MENRDTHVQGGDKETAHPGPSRVLNEDRATESLQGQHQGGRQTQGGYKYKGGRQAQGGVPNPDDPNDHESAGSFRGTASQSGENRDQCHTESSDDETRNPA